jgi:hypothetical protein
MTAFYDLGTNVVQLDTLSPTQAITSTTNGSSVDVRTRKGAGLIILDSAAGTGTTPTNTVTIQDSADGSTGWAAVVHPILGAAAFTQLTTVASQQAITFDFDNCRGFIRVVDTLTGTTPSYTRSINAVSRKGV